MQRMGPGKERGAFAEDVKCSTVAAKKQPPLPPTGFVVARRLFTRKTNLEQQCNAACQGQGHQAAAAPAPAQSTEPTCQGAVRQSSFFSALLRASSRHPCTKSSSQPRPSPRRGPRLPWPPLTERRKLARVRRCSAQRPLRRLHTKAHGWRTDAFVCHDDNAISLLQLPPVIFEFLYLPLSSFSFLQSPSFPFNFHVTRTSRGSEDRALRGAGHPPGTRPSQVCSAS